MVEPVTTTVAIVSLVGTVILAIIQVFRSGWSCDQVRSDCCTTTDQSTTENDVNINTLNINRN